MATVTVLVTLLNDRRVLRTLRSLAEQARPPEDVLVADGGSKPDLLAELREWAKAHPNVRVEHHPGTIPETRNSALEVVRSDVVAFLDADQVAPPGWLAALVAPIERGEADVTGGPTRPLAPARTRAEDYINKQEAWVYANAVPHDPTMMPMGNTAWRRAVFEKVGSFDRTLVLWCEDYDLNLRAAAAGFRIQLVPGAWVYHDQSHLNSFRKVFKRRFTYTSGTVVVYLKNGTLWKKVPASARASAKFRHPYELMNWAIKPMALVRGWWVWRRSAGRARR